MNEQQLFNGLKSVLAMEWYGIRAEETKEIGYATHHYVSVPESSTIEIEDQELNEKIKTADGLKKVARDMLVKQVLDYCEAEFDDEESDDSVYIDDDFFDCDIFYHNCLKNHSEREVYTILFPIFAPNNVHIE